QLVGVPEIILEGTFIKGLKQDVRAAVRVLNPEGLSHAMKLAVSIEENKLFRSASQGGGTNSATNYSNCISGSESEMAEKRSKGLCFKCDEKYGPGHQCKSKSLQVLWVDDSDARENEPYLQVKPWDHALKAD
ncbi:hypothetical protein Tco_0055400, partial [Tanacetum coccineum]